MVVGLDVARSNRVYISSLLQAPSGVDAMEISEQILNKMECE